MSLRVGWVGYNYINSLTVFATQRNIPTVIFILNLTKTNQPDKFPHDEATEHEE